MKYGLLGRVLGHSWSPLIHEELFTILGTDDTYALLEREPEQVKGYVLENNDGLKGSNVTLPYKEAVIPYLAELSPEAEKIGAVNTILFTPEGAKGYNTDYTGFDRMLQNAEISLTGKSVTVLGNGGAAKAVLQDVVDQKAAHIRLVVRNEQKAREGLSHFFAQRPDTEVVSFDAVKEGGNVVINTTPVGMSPAVGVSPLPAEITAQFDAAVDVIYNPLSSQFLKDARKAGKKTCNGLYMLVAQAVAAEEIWQGRAIEASLVAPILRKIEEKFHD